MKFVDVLRLVKQNVSHGELGCEKVRPICHVALDLGRESKLEWADADRVLSLMAHRLGSVNESVGSYIYLRYRRNIQWSALLQSIRHEWLDELINEFDEDLPSDQRRLADLDAIIRRRVGASVAPDVSQQGVGQADAGFDPN